MSNAAPPCPYCGSIKSRVYTHGRGPLKGRRYRKCENGHTFRTIEMLDSETELFYCPSCDNEKWSFLSVHGPQLETPLNIRQAIAMYQPAHIYVADCGQHKNRPPQNGAASFSIKPAPNPASPARAKAVAVASTEHS